MSSRFRAVVALAATLAMVSPLAGVLPAQAAVASTVSLSVAPAVAAPAETVVLSGVVSPVASGRTVWLQRYGSSWSTVLSVTTSSTGHFSGSVRAGLAGSKTSWRAVARPTVTAAQAISVTRVLTVVKQALSLSAPASAETALAFALSGSGYPARVGRVVVVQRLSGTSWVEVGRTTQSSTGYYVVRTSVSSASRFTYRAVALAWHGAAAVVSVSRVVSAHAPYILLTPPVAIAAETVKATGKLPGVYSRPVWVQRRSGTSWVTLVKATTSSTGSYATSFHAPLVGSYAVRALAPAVTIAGKVRAQYVSGAKTLTVVAQTALLSMPTALVQATTGTGTLTFRPVRAGRAVALQVLKAGVWTAVGTGVQSSTGTASLPVTAGTPGTYSYRAWTAAAAGAPAFVSATRTLTVTTGPVSGVSAVPASTSIALSWTNPTTASFTGVMIRRALGATPPATATAGTLITDAAKPATSYTNTGLTAGTQYSYALFAHNGTPVYATAATVTSTTTAAGSGAVSGTVTDAGGTHHGLANVSVEAYTASVGDSGTTVTATTTTNGSYTVTGLPAATDYTVCFTATGATGGSSDATEYIAQCYNNQPTSDTATPVTVTADVTTTGINAALAGGGAVSGTVTDAGGTHHGLANVTAVVTTSTSVRAVGSATTAANGGYTVTGLPAATDYTVCFTGSAATGGSSDTTGYLAQCYTPTPVTVTVGATTTGINAALTAGGAISGTVTDAGGTHHGLARVRVTVRVGGFDQYAWTAADGTWSMTGLSARTYWVCFKASWWATGGSSDVIGYADQCYNNQPGWSTSSPVPVTVGATTTGINAALVAAGAMSGTVTDAGGTQHGLAGVQVHMFSPTTGDNGDATTAADGSYTVPRLTAGSYRVCFGATGATGGSSDALGYVDQCYPTQVWISLGATRTGINAALVGGGAVSGTVTDGGGTHHGLANVGVTVTSASTGTYESATTAADGSYTVTGLPSATDYNVRFYGSGATGGSSDATGYFDQWYNNQPTSDTATPVTVTAGATTTGVNAALIAAGAISGTVTDAGGTQHGLANVTVTVHSASTGSSSYAWTAADGSYTVPRLAAGTDYTVCFDAWRATGGSSDALGYVDQCYNNQPTSDTATPVTVTSGATRTGVNAALVGKP